VTKAVNFGAWKLYGCSCGDARSHVSALSRHIVLVVGEAGLAGQILSRQLLQTTHSGVVLLQKGQELGGHPSSWKGVSCRLILSTKGMSYGHMKPEAEPPFAWLSLGCGSSGVQIPFRCLVIHIEVLHTTSDYFGWSLKILQGWRIAWHS